MNLEPSYYLKITDNYNGYNATYEYIITKKSEHYLHACLAQVPVELRYIVLAYFGDEYGYAENFIYLRILKKTSMLYFMANYFNIHNRLRHFDVLILNGNDEIIVDEIEISPYLFLDVYEKFSEERLRFWKKTRK
jgi:hypothetical protein